MTLQHSPDAVFFVWIRLSATRKAFKGTVTARSALDAGIVAQERWGAAARYEVKEWKHGRTVVWA